MICNVMLGKHLLVDTMYFMHFPYVQNRDSLKLYIVNVRMII